jgi:hypothetical protein
VSLWAAIRAPVLEIADQFFLPGIDQIAGSPAASAAFTRSLM